MVRHLTALLALVFPVLAFAADAPPNILYIMSDDHASHAISAYGSKINKTPNLDRLAREGIRFDNAFVTNALCGPSRACLLTGKYSHLNGFPDNRNNAKFDGSQQTFNKLLGKAGYQTAVVGKWHLGSDPVGFDHWDIMPGQGRYHDPIFLTNGQRNVVKGYVTDVITDKVIERLEKRDKSKPFCFLYHHKAPHRAWEPDDKHAKMYEDGDIPLPETFWDDYKNRGTAAKDQDMSVAKTLTKTDLKIDPPAGLTGEKLVEWKYQRYIKDYLRVVASVDDNVGRVLDYLDKTGLAQNTIVIYTADNGFFLGDHGWFDKRFMYEQSMRVPLMIRYPGKIKAGSVAKELVNNVDFAPTFLDYAGVKVPEDMQGRSMRPILEGQTPADWRKSIYYRYYEFPQPHHVHPHYGIRTDRYKLIFFNTLNEWEMYDLEKDPNEMKNVYLAPDYSEVRDRLTKELERVKADLKDTAK
ncbi:MAG TPA: sulfatase [Tepidisphaeraceae bacterium]|nr:sulfatase [Tepidisphaeraceae bacterium]